MTHEYVLAARDHQPRGRNGVEMWRLTWYRLTDGTLWEMTLDSSYRNYHRSAWPEIVRSEQPWAVYTGLRATRRRTHLGMPVLSADSHPQRITDTMTQDQAMAIVELRDQELHPRPITQQLWSWA